MENPSCVMLDPEEKSISLAWYIDLFAEHRYTFDFGDCSRFLFELPDLFEDSELVVVVSWPDARCILYAGESCGMDIIDMDFPDALWK